MMFCHHEIVPSHLSRFLEKESSYLWNILSWTFVPDGENNSQILVFSKCFSLTNWHEIVHVFETSYHELLFLMGRTSRKFWSFSKALFAFTNWNFFTTFIMHLGKVMHEKGCDKIEHVQEILQGLISPDCHMHPFRHTNTDSALLSWDR
jgi:hypothetical protein